MDNQSFLLTLGSILITVLIGIIGIYYTLKQRNRLEITFLKNACIPLFRSIVKNLDEIEIKFKGNKIGENLILFKGTILNSGNLDIDQSIVHEPLSIKLPKDFFWVQNKVIDTSEGLNVCYSNDGGTLTFVWELFKAGEYYSFDSLIEYIPGSDKSSIGELDLKDGMLKKLTFSHRISNLRSVKRVMTMQKPLPIRGLIPLYLILLGFIFFGVYLSVGPLFFPSYEVYNEFRIDSTLTSAHIRPVDSVTVRLVNYERKVNKKITLNDYEKQSTNRLIILRKEISFLEIFLGCLLIIASIGGIIKITLIETRNKKIYANLKTVTSANESIELHDLGDIEST